MVDFYPDNAGVANPAEIPIHNDCREPGPGRGLYVHKLGRTLDVNDIGHWILFMPDSVVGNYVTYDGGLREDWDAVPYQNLNSIREKAVKLVEITAQGQLCVMRENMEFLLNNDNCWLPVETFIQYF